jgi:tetratricopeptide (TPR) repeat protein
MGSFVIQSYEAMKDEANSSFRSKDMEKAEWQYKEVMSRIEELGTPEELMQIYLAVLNNVAATLLQVNKLDEVIVYTTKSIALDDRNIKAYYRRACAMRDLDPPEFDRALEDVDKILEVETANSQALALKKELGNLRIKMGQTAGPRKDPTALGSGSHTGSLATTAGVSKAPAPEPVSASEMGDLAAEYGSFTVKDWKPPEPASPTGDLPAKPLISLPERVVTAAGTAGPCPAKPDAGAAMDIMSFIQARKKAAAGSKTASVKEAGSAAVEGNAAVRSVFDMLQAEEAQTRQVFKKKIVRNKEIEKTTTAKPKAAVVKKKDPARDPRKLHNQPDRFAEDAVDAWKELGSDEASKTSYVKQLLEEKKRMEKANLARAAYVKKSEDDDYSESDEDE